MPTAESTTERDRARFWAKVNKDGPVPERMPHLGPCWIWTGAPGTKGYGQFKLRGKTLIAHRVSYALAYGEASLGTLCALHRCDNPPCVNSSHLFLGTKAENCNDRHAKGRTARGTRHGSHTHPESRRGERNGRAKLTREQVDSIPGMRASGMTQAEVGRLLGVSQVVISSIELGKTWVIRPPHR